MDKLPIHSHTNPRPRPGNKIKVLKRLLTFGILTLFSLFSLNLASGWQASTASRLPVNVLGILEKCRALNVSPGPPSDFHQRSRSDRYVPGTPPTLLKNATIWTGRVSGLEVISGDLFLDKGLIKAVGEVKESTFSGYSDLVTLDVGGAWISPGIVDLHSHLGVGSSPGLSGASDTNSHKGLALPWLRSLDGLNTHDESYRLSISGGVTTALVLPGSANAIGGQAFVIKLRPTAERSPSSMLLEPPFSLNGTLDPSLPARWRQMKHACGENPSRVYSGTRMDTIWAFRQAYDTARKIKRSQDEYCSRALAGQWDGLEAYPEDLQWEALVDVLRGRVKVHTHCYETTDLDGLVRLSNEFKFPIAAFHHAHETYLVPDLLKKAYGHPPAVAQFATNARYKRESYRGSEFGPRILADHGLKVVMKSDHPVLNSRYLLYEAQQAHYYGLPDNLALAAVTTTPATVMGQDHRIGFIKPGYDADIVVWDSHPLALGAAPMQVYTDGISQIKTSYTVGKPQSFQRVPVTPNFDQEAADAVEYDGLPPLEIKNKDSDVVMFTNVRSIYIRQGRIIRQVLSPEGKEPGIVVVKDGTVICTGTCPDTSVSPQTRQIDLEGGSILPGLISFGSPLGLDHIQAEASSNDGYVYDPLTMKVPDILSGGVIRAVDGLQFASRDALLAHRTGVTLGVTAPKSAGFLSGMSTVFSTGAPHRLEKGAVIQDEAALHLTLGSTIPSTSSQISALRRLLLGDGQGELASRFRDVIQGKSPIIINVQSADVMASLIELKREVEERSGHVIRMTFNGASEAHLLAKEISLAGIGVILSPSRPFPGTWQSRRILPGPPLTKESAISRLVANNVTVGIGIEEIWSARNTRFDIAWAALEAGSMLSRTEAIALASVNLEVLLGIDTDNNDLVVIKGGSPFNFEGKVISIISPRCGTVDLF